MDLEIDLSFDSRTAATIREFEARKKQAVADENYDEAKRMKDAINRLKTVGKHVARLEVGHEFGRDLGVVVEWPAHQVFSLRMNLVIVIVHWML